jgi:fructose-bisphosphate aldolase class II
MALVSMKEILEDAKAKQYAVGSFNSIDLQMARGVIEAAEEEKSPVILCHAAVHFKYTPLEKAAYVLLNEAKDAKIPVAVLLDHGKDFDSIIKAMHLGFNAVMFDGSQYDYDENVLKTRDIVRIAHALGISVEGELGRVARPKSGFSEGSDDDSIIRDTSLYTDPDMAGDFAEKTGVDALACSFGTVHGVYMEKPRLDFQRLGLIAEKTNIPIVMHGGSGLSEQDFSESIKKGVCKINYYTNMALSTAEYIKNKLLTTERAFYHDITQWSIEAIKEDIQKTIRVFGSSGKA